MKESTSIKSVPGNREVGSVLAARKNDCKSSLTDGCTRQLKTPGFMMEVHILRNRPKPKRLYVLRQCALRCGLFDNAQAKEIVLPYEISYGSTISLVKCVLSNFSRSTLTVDDKT